MTDILHQFIYKFFSLKLLICLESLDSLILIVFKENLI